LGPAACRRKSDLTCKDDPGAIINIMARVGVNQDLTLTSSVPWLSPHMIPKMMTRK